MKLFLPALLLPGLCLAAILPDTIGPFHRASTSPPALADRPLWDEYGLKDSEAAAYQNGPAKFTATAYRLQDTTACLAAFDWQRPPQSTPSKLANLAAETADSLLLVNGNYLLSFQGYKPTAAELATLTQAILNVDTTSLPALAGYLPAQNLVPNSERYILGPAGLQKFDPGISPSVAAFHFGTEAQLGVFHSPKGDLTLAIFNYPTHQIAMQRIADFEKLPGAVVKRSGPMVAVVLSPPDPDFAERLLSGIRYQAEVTRDEYVPTRRDNIGNLLLNAFILIGILLAFSVASGLALGGFRALVRRGHKGEEADAMISLHLEER
ncbi:conserved exported hypothetical protein [Candidatus Sulfopaludibacter sp. SbA4]|nr:conserved exported hypothetical protein [Candidatus Sulfopaludibacter sp. SbA4]